MSIFSKFNRLSGKSLTWWWHCVILIYRETKKGYEMKTSDSAKLTKIDLKIKNLWDDWHNLIQQRNKIQNKLDKIENLLYTILPNKRIKITSHGERK